VTKKKGNGGRSSAKKNKYNNFYINARFYHKLFDNIKTCLKLLIKLLILTPNPGIFII